MTKSSTNNELVVLVKESQLPKSKAEYILENFKGYFELAKEWEKKAENLVVTRDDQVAEMKMAREGRLFLAKKRIAIEHVRKELKAEALREGQTIDSIARVLKNLIIPIEEHLEKQEKFLEIKEKLRKQQLREERIKAIQKFEDLIPFDTGYPDVENWNNQTWDAYIKGLESQYFQKQQEIKKAEAERKKAEEAEKKRIQALELHHKRSNILAHEGLTLPSDKHLGLITESEFLILKKELKAKKKAEEEARKAEQARLKAEAEKREKELEAKRKLEEEARKKAEAERAKRDRELAEARKKAEEEARKKDAEIQKLKAEKEAQKKKEAEARKKAEEEARKKAEAPDIEKAKQLIDDIRNFQIPEFQTEKYQKLRTFILNSLYEMIEKIYDQPEFKEILK